MKLLIVLSAVFLLTVSAVNCGAKKNTTTTYKGKLETKGICMNYTLRLIEGSIDTSLINTSWTDEVTGTKHTNAFGLVNPCDFPDSIKQGDEFYFVIDTSAHKQCAVCMAYYPTPAKKLGIKVVQK